MGCRRQWTEKPVVYAGLGSFESTLMTHAIAGGEDNTPDHDRLDGLLREAKQEDETYAALVRKGAVHVFRCGRKLMEARTLAKALKANWFSLLEEHKIAESTARQAIALFEQVIAAGYTEEEIEGKGITEAKVEFRVLKSPKQKEEERRRTEESRGNDENDKKPPAEEVGKREGGEESPGKAFDKEKGTSYGSPSSPTGGPQPDEADGRVDEDQVFGEIEISDLLIARQQQLNEGALVRWNEGREQPYPEEYLLVLFDLGVLTLEDGEVCYLPDQEDDREQLVLLLGDKLAPILERWATADDVVLALKGLVFDESAGSETTQTQATPAGEQKKRRPRVRRAGGGHPA